MSTLNNRLKSFVSTTNKDNVTELILEVRTIILCIGNNSEIFSSPTPSLDSVAQSIADLEVAEMFVTDNLPGSIPARNLQYEIVLKIIDELFNYVKSVADNAADKSTSISIIHASGFNFSKNNIS